MLWRHGDIRDLYEICRPYVTVADTHTFQSVLKVFFLCPFAPKLRQEV